MPRRDRPLGTAKPCSIRLPPNLSTSSTPIRWRRTTATPGPQAAVAMDGITNHPLLNQLHSSPHERDRLTDTNVFERSSRVIVALAALVFCLWLMEGPK